MYYFYVLYSLKDHKFYKGCTSHLLNRIQQHNAGRTISSKHRRPFILIYFEQFQTKKDALHREKISKSLEGGQALREVLKHKKILNEKGHLHCSCAS